MSILINVNISFSWSCADVLHAENTIEEKEYELGRQAHTLEDGHTSTLHGHKARKM